MRFFVLFGRGKGGFGGLAYVRLFSPVSFRVLHFPSSLRPVFEVSLRSGSPLPSFPPSCVHDPFWLCVAPLILSDDVFVSLVCLSGYMSAFLRAQFSFSACCSIVPASRCTSHHCGLFWVWPMRLVSSLLIALVYCVYGPVVLVLQVGHDRDIALLWFRYRFGFVDAFRCLHSYYDSIWAHCCDSVSFSCMCTFPALLVPFLLSSVVFAFPFCICCRCFTSRRKAFPQIRFSAMLRCLFGSCSVLGFPCRG